MNDSDPVDIELTKLFKPSHDKGSKNVLEDYKKKISSCFHEKWKYGSGSGHF